MAYNGYLIKVGNYKIPADRFIKTESYSAYVNMQDYEPWTDANGYLHRQVVDLKALKVEFETPILTNTEFNELYSNIKNNLSKPNERGCTIEVYIPEYDDYVTQYGYLADFTPQIYRIEGNTIWYNPIRFAFIGGVANDWWKYGYF